MTQPVSHSRLIASYLELADLTFQRQWRERLVRPFLELADKRVAALADFSEAAAVGNFERALTIAHARTRTDVVAGAVTFWQLDGLANLRGTSDAGLASSTR